MRTPCSLAWALDSHEVSVIGLSDREQLALAWQAASDDLGIRVTIPWALELSDGRVHTFVALVHEFGAERGMLIDTPEGIRASMHELNASAREYGYSGISGLYLTYARERYIEALNDWGWAGSGPPPSRYGEKPAPAV